MPARRSSVASASARSPRSPSSATMKTLGAPGGPRRRSSSASAIRSIPSAQPAAGVGRPAELLDQAVVAPAAADLGLGAEPRRSGPRRRCACSSRARGPSSGRPRRRRRRRRAARRTASKCSASSPSRRSSRRGASAITAGSPRRSASKARSGLRSIRSRTSFDSSSSLRAQVLAQLVEVGGAAPRASPRLPRRQLHLLDPAAPRPGR